MSRRKDNAGNMELPSSIYASDEVNWSPYIAGWQVDYHSLQGRGETKRKAFDDLNRELVACGDAPAICFELIA